MYPSAAKLNAGRTLRLKHTNGLRLSAAGLTTQQGRILPRGLPAGLIFRPRMLPQASF